MNNCVFVGRLTDDPRIRYANNEAQTAVARMSIAVDRPVRKGEEKKADFFRCVCFGQKAEFAANYLRKGKRIAVQGRMQNESFVGKDGNKVEYSELLTTEINFADGKDEPAGAAEKEEGRAGQGSAAVSGNSNGRTGSVAESSAAERGSSSGKASQKASAGTTGKLSASGSRSAETGTKADGNRKNGNGSVTERARVKQADEGFMDGAAEDEELPFH